VLVVSSWPCEYSDVAARKSKRGGARPGAGRPAILEERRSVTLHIEAAQRERLGQIAEARGVSVSDLIRQAIDAFLRRSRGEKR